MFSQQTTHPQALRLGAFAGMFSLIFLAGVIIQLPLTGWFPEYALQAGTMVEWLNHLALQKPLALLGIGLSVLAILSFLPFGLMVYRTFPRTGFINQLGLSLYLAGITLALVAFTFAFGFSWGLADLVRAGGNSAGELEALATMGMRGFLAGDDLATTLIGLGHFCFALSSLRSGYLPKWLAWWGMIAGTLVALVLLRYFIPALEVLAIGYPLVILWFGLTGIQLLRKADKAVESKVIQSNPVAG